MKAVRFTLIVEQCGTPRAHTLWVPADEDPEFRRARDTHRVMTIHPAGPTGRDVGHVGFVPDAPGAQFLVFPKSLQRFEGAPVIGIKFDRVEQPARVPAGSATGPARSTPRRGVSNKTAHRSGPPAAEQAAPKPVPAPATAAVDRPSPGPPPRTQLRQSRRRSPPPAARPTPPAPPPVDRPASRAASDAKTTAPVEKVLALEREIRSALQELEDGKAVAAYNRLRRAVDG